MHCQRLQSFIGIVSEGDPQFSEDTGKRLREQENRRVLDWLLVCPEKGFFVPIESESSDML